jgi:large subunit ribosomal protein L22
MEVRATYRFLRMSPHKVRQVVDLIRGRQVDNALAILRFTPRAAARAVSKVLASAIANAENNVMLSREDLYVAAITADEGPRLKRWRPRARGRADRILKRTCHVTVVLDEYEEAR